MEPGLLKSAEWPLLIDIYFFLGGIAGGAFVIATIANLLDAERYRSVVRAGYFVALLAVIPAPILLIVDLGLPTRFLHMMMVSKPSTQIGMGALTLGPFHLKLLSPMSVGAWGLLVFSACAFLAALDVFLEQRGGRGFPGFRLIIGLVGSVFGFFLAAYPGVLLGATARPLFVNGHWLGALFLAVGASTGGAATALALTLFGRERRDGIAALMRTVAIALVVQAVALVLFIVTVKMSGSIGINEALTPLVSGQYSLTFWLGAVTIGLIVPLALAFSGRLRRASAGLAALVAILVLVGGFVTKYVLVAAGQVT
jgi:formate-dependent nitrite reductase membrane component NrfD